MAGIVAEACDNFLCASSRLSCSLLATATAQERPLPDYDTFAAQVKKHLATDEERQSGYMFIERRLEQKVDGAGRVTSQR